MACFAKQHFLPQNPSQQEESVVKKIRPPFHPIFHQQSVDISRRSSNRLPWKTRSLQKKRIRSCAVVVPPQHKETLKFSPMHSRGAREFAPLYRETLKLSSLHREISRFPFLHREVLDCQQSRAKKALFVASASSASYSETVEEGLLRLGGISLCRRDLQIASGAASTIIFAVANKVLYKMALVPLKDYPFFLALINTFGYVLVYFSILYIRYQAGIVTDDMLELPKSHFILSGALEALGVASGMAAAAVLPGTLIAVLLQTFLVWQLVLSMVFLKKRFSFGQIVGCTMVLAGVAVALVGSGSGLGLSGDQTGLFWPLLMILSCAFQASSTIVKEFVFRNASKHLKRGSVDIFVVNSFGSAFQAIFVILMLPFLSQLRGVPFSQLGGYMTDGAGCLFNIGSMSAECSGATLLTFSYVVVNLAFNISLLSLLKMSSAVVSSLCSTLAVPFSIYMFTLPLPYVGATASLHPRFLVGTTILLSGLAFYNFFGCFKNAKRE